LQQQVISRLQQADVQLTATPRNGGGSQDAVELHITVDRHGEVSLVKIASPSARPGLAERLLKIITEAGPLTAPPASLMAFNQYLTVKIRFDVNAGRAPARQA
jgi:TonB family protein